MQESSYTFYFFMYVTEILGSCDVL